jgi:hypothetical protein
VKGFLQVTVDSLERAQNILVELQDSMSPVEVGDAELPAGLAEVRGILADLSSRPQCFVSLFGR